MICRVALLALASGACVEPVYDDRLGVAGVPVDEGALAGRFSLVSSAADLAHLPLVGDQVSGGMSFLLVERSWDGVGYAQTNTLCRVLNFDVAGLVSEVSEATARTVPPFAVPTLIDHERGAVSTERFAELWAVHDLDDGDAMPTAPDDPRFYDMDSDDKPGATMATSGLVSGEVYFAQRKLVSYAGVVRGRKISDLIERAVSEDRERHTDHDAGGDR